MISPGRPVKDIQIDANTTIEKIFDAVSQSGESPTGKLRDELLNGEIFYTLREAQVLVEWWRQHS